MAKLALQPKKHKTLFKIGIYSKIIHIRLELQISKVYFNKEFEQGKISIVKPLFREQ